MASTYTWSVVSGSPPPGTTVNGSETDLDTVLSGTPTTVGVYNFTVRITNDISGAFDDQAFSVTIGDVFLEITPDLGLSAEEMFDLNTNKHLLQISRTLLIDQGVQTPGLYQPLNNLSLNLDLGAGVKTYEIPQEYLRSFNVRNRVYLYRLTSAPDTIKAIRIV